MYTLVLQALAQPVARTYTQLPPLDYLKTKLRLTDRYPSGLEWVDTSNQHKAGEMAGKWQRHLRRYTLYLLGNFYYAHRIVYYLRTGINPGNKDIIHTPDNKDRDNRKELVVFERKTVKPPTRRNRRRSDYASDYIY